MTALLDHRETADGYHGEIFRRGGYRVVVCKDGAQWILQRQRPKKSSGGAAWDALGYFVTRNALARVYRAKSGAPAPEIGALPEWFSRGAPK